jgi:hypothetical protein
MALNKQQEDDQVQMAEALDSFVVKDKKKCSTVWTYWKKLMMTTGRLS